MVQPLASHNPHQSTLRQLKWLVALLILSNIGLGIFGFYVLRSIDRRYSDLISRAVPLLSNLQTLTARSVDAMRGTGPTLLDAPADHRAELLRHSRQVLQSERAYRLQQLTRFGAAAAEPDQRELRDAGEAFTTLSGQVLDLAAAGKWDEAKRLRDAQLRPAFERYHTAITKSSDQLEAASLRANDDYSAATGSMSNVILGVASWPVILFVGLLLVTAIFALSLMVLFRGRETGDAP